MQSGHKPVANASVLDLDLPGSRAGQLADILLLFADYMNKTAGLISLLSLSVVAGDEGLPGTWHGSQAAAPAGMP